MISMSSNENEEGEPLIRVVQPLTTQGVHQNYGLKLSTTAVFLVGEMMGIGVLALPSSLAHSGWVGVALIVMAALIAGYNGTHLGYCWNMVVARHPEYSLIHTRLPYPLIGEKAFGKWMGYVVRVAIDFTMFGSCVVYLILASTNVHSMLTHINVHMSFCVYIVITTVFLTPFTYFGSPKDFWWIAICAAVTALAGCLLLLVTLLLQIPNLPDEVSHTNPASVSSFSLAFGTILFAYGGAATFPTIQHDMRQPERFKIAVVIAFCVLLVIYLPVAISGYYVFGVNAKANIMQSLPQGNLRTSIEALITTHLVCAFIIIISPVSQDIEQTLGIPHDCNYKRILSRTALMGFALFMAETIPHFSALLNLLGGSTVTFLTFVAPSLFYMRLKRKSTDVNSSFLELHSIVINGMIIIIGVIGGIASTYAAILELTSKDTFVPPCYINSTAAVM